MLWLRAGSACKGAAGMIGVLITGTQIASIAAAVTAVAGSVTACAVAYGEMQKIRREVIETRKVEDDENQR